MKGENKMKTYDILVNGKMVQGLSSSQVKQLSAKYSVKILASYKTSENDYNSLEIKKEEC